MEECAQQPTAACEIEADIEPMDLRRTRALVETVERSKRQDKNHPNRKVVDNWKEMRCLQRYSPMDKVKEQEPVENLPQNRKEENKCPYPPPWVDIRQLTINTCLLEPEVNKQTNTHYSQLFKFYSDIS